MKYYKPSKFLLFSFIKCDLSLQTDHFCLILVILVISLKLVTLIFKRKLVFTKGEVMSVLTYTMGMEIEVVNMWREENTAISSITLILLFLFLSCAKTHNFIA